MTTPAPTLPLPTAAEAAALYAASKATPNLVDTIAALATSSVRVTERVTTQATATIVGLWRRTDPRDEVAVQRFSVEAAKVVTAAQRTVTTVTAADQVQQLRAAGVRVKVNPVSIDDVRGSHTVVGDIAGADSRPAANTHERAQRPKSVIVHYEDRDRTATRAGATAEEILRRPANVYRLEIKGGASEPEARATSVRRIESLVDDNLMLAQRNTEHQVLVAAAKQDRRVIGYRRIIHPEFSRGGVCGLCVAASHRVYRVETLRPVHARCKCTSAAVTSTYDPGGELNDRDIAQLYDDAGGTGHRLKRTRYSIEYHGELGPVLTRVAGEKVPYYSSTPPAFVDLDAPA